MDINTLKLDIARGLQQICQTVTNVYLRIGDLKSLPTAYRRFMDVGSISEDVVDTTTVASALLKVCQEVDKRVTRDELRDIINEILDERESRQKPLDFGEAEDIDSLNSLVTASLRKARG